MCVTVNIETQMRVVESVADAFPCVTHGMIQSIVDQIQKIIHQNQAVIHLHRQQIRLQQMQQQQQRQLHHQQRQVQPVLQPQH